MNDELIRPDQGSIFAEAQNRAIARVAIELFQKSGCFPLLDVRTGDFRTDHNEKFYYIDYQPVDFGPRVRAGVTIDDQSVSGIMIMNHLMYLRGDAQLLLQIEYSKTLQDQVFSKDFLLNIQGTSAINGSGEQRFIVLRDTGRRNYSVASHARGLFGMIEEFKHEFNTNPITEQADWPTFCLSIPALNLLDESRIGAIFARWPNTLSHLHTDLDARDALRELSLRIIEERPLKSGGAI